MAFGNEPLDGSLTIPPSTVYSKENNTFPALVGEPGAYQDSFANQSSVPVMSFLRPRVWQSAHNVTGSGGKVLTCAFVSSNIAGNSIVVCVGLGEVENGSTITLAITDTLGNTYAEAVNASQSTTLEAAIFYATNVLGGTNTITVTIAGGSSSNTAIAVQIYEVFGVISVSGALDTTNTGSNAGSTSISTGAVAPVVPNELAFVAIAAGGGTITAGTNWTLDSTSLSPTGGNLVSFGAQSRLHTQISSLTPSATLSVSNAWAACIATFKTVIVPIQGTVIANAGANLNTSALALESGGHLATIDTSTAALNTLAGTSADANTVASFMGRLTKIRDLLLGFVFDNTDRLKTSLYVKTSAAADTLLTLGQATKANSLPVTLASDSTESVNVGTPTASAISVGTGSTTVVTPGASAKFLLLTNDSPNTIYLNISGGSAALNAGVRLNGNGGSILFDRYIPSAAITAISSVASSNLLVEVG